MLRLAGRTDAAVTAVGGIGRGAAIGAEAMPVVPVDKGLRLTKNGDLGWLQERGGRARIAEMAEARERRRQGIGKRRDVPRKKGDPVVETKENFRRPRVAETARERALDEGKRGRFG